MLVQNRSATATAGMLRRLMTRGDRDPVRLQSRRIEYVADGAADSSLVNYQLRSCRQIRALSSGIHSLPGITRTLPPQSASNARL